MADQTFINFLASKPANCQYNYHDRHNCPYAQYLRSTGANPIYATPDHWFTLLFGFIPWFWNIPIKHNRVLLTEPHTYGAALDRARRALQVEIDCG